MPLGPRKVVMAMLAGALTCSRALYSCNSREERTRGVLFFFSCMYSCTEVQAAGCHGDDREVCARDVVAQVATLVMYHSKIPMIFGITNGVRVTFWHKLLLRDVPLFNLDDIWHHEWCKKFGIKSTP